MNYLIPLGGAILCNTIDKLASRRALSSSARPDAYLLVYQLACLAISFPGAIIAVLSPDAARRPLGELAPSAWLLVIAAMAAWSLYGVATFRSASVLDLSITATIGSSKLIWAALLGVVLFGESLSWIQVLGLLTVVGAQVVLQRAPLVRFGTAGTLYAALAAFALSMALALDKLLLESLSAPVVLFLGFAGSSITGAALNRQTAWLHLRRLALSALLAAIAGSAGYYCLLLAMASGPLSVVVPVSQSSQIIFVVAGILVLKERVGIRPKLLASAVSACGAVLIFIGG